MPVFGPGTVTAIAEARGFPDVHPIDARESDTAGLTVTATPRQHGVHEVTFVLQATGRTVLFGGDTLRIPEWTRSRTGSSTSTWHSCD